MVVIGDTRTTFHAVIGAWTVAVGTGPRYTLEELEACEPWLTLAELPPPQELERIIGLEDGVRD